jgi:hypothetical protein
MGIVIVKAVRGQDVYLLWSSVTDRPEFVGTREEVRHALDQPVRGQRWPHEHEVEEWLQRADRFGSSAWAERDDWTFGWEGSGLVYRQQGRIPRDRLYEYARRILDGPEGTFQDDPGDLLVPFDRHTATED